MTVAAALPFGVMSKTTGRSSVIGLQWVRVRRSHSSRLRLPKPTGDIGGALLAHLRLRGTPRMCSVATSAAASGQSVPTRARVTVRHLAGPRRTSIETYWSIPDRQIEALGRSRRSSGRRNQEAPNRHSDLRGGLCRASSPRHRGRRGPVDPGHGAVCSPRSKIGCPATSVAT